MSKLFWLNLKMLFRQRQMLFWSLAFPTMFTIIFGFFFGGEETSVGTISIINQSETELATTIENTLVESDVFKIEEVDTLEEAEEMIETNDIVSAIFIPEGFGTPLPDAPKEIDVYLDPGNLTSNQIITAFLGNMLTRANFQVNGVEPIFSINEVNSTSNELTYFEFVLVGLIGLALMNSSVQGIAITMSKYREDQILKRLVTTPIKPWKFVFAEVFSRLVVNIIQIVVILSIGVFGFGANIVGSLWLTVIFALISAFLFQLLGFVVASFSKNADAAQGMAMTITIPMMFLAGVFFPIDQLPKWLNAIVEWLPLAPLLRMLRAVMLEAKSPFLDPMNIIVVAVWIVAASIISVYRFKLSDE